MAAEGGNFIRNYRGHLIPIVRFTYTGADGEVIPREATHIFVQARVVQRHAFEYHRNIVEVICHEDVEKIEAAAFYGCSSLRRVIMPGVKIVELRAFTHCEALDHLECGKLEIIKKDAFYFCTSLRSINLPSARIVGRNAIDSCEALTDVKFGSKLEKMGEMAFCACKSLERITIPLKNGLTTEDNTFIGCDNLDQVDLVEGELHETIASLQSEEWRNDMNEEIDSINQILPSAAAGGWVNFSVGDPGEKAHEIRRWIRSVLRKIIRYQEEHRRLLEEEIAPTLELVLSNNDIVMNNVLPFLELPSYTFDVDDEEDDGANHHSLGEWFDY